MSASDYTLRLTPARQRGLDRLPSSAAAAVAEFMVGDLVSTPRRVGKPLRADLDGLWSARRGPYRIVYDIDDGRRVVSVVRIKHRGDVYRPR